MGVFIEKPWAFIALMDNLTNHLSEDYNFPINFPGIPTNENKMNFMHKKDLNMPTMFSQPLSGVCIKNCKFYARVCSIEVPVIDFT